MRVFLKIFCFFFIALTGRDPVGAAIGAVATETAAEAMDKPGVSHEERQKIAQKARLIGDTVAFVAGRDVGSADKAGRTAVENNFEDHLVEIDGQLALLKAVFSEEEAAPYLELLDDAEKRTFESMKDPIVNTIAVGVAGMGVPLVAKTLTVVGTAATAHYFGSIAIDSGTQGLVQEGKDHPIMTTLAVMPFVPGPKGLGLAKSGNRIGVKTLRKGIDVNDTRTFIKSVASAKNPMLQKTERIIQNEPVYKVLKDTGF